ncbi:MAG: TatD family hydrolase [Nitrospirae bacterium]|nr:TatD family hydrolase [Nitrospirota bacterium]
MTFSDTHCHLEMLGNEGEIKGKIARAREAGLGLMVSIGTDLASSQEAGEFARAYPEVYATIGVHPHEAKLATDDTLEQFMEMIRNNTKIRGIGETGLDFYYDHSPRDIQTASFIGHIELAKKTGLPLVVHSRNAPKETIEVLKEHDAGKTGGIIHCFSENLEMARGAIELGFLISFSGIITFKTAGELQKVILDVPLDRILIETDSPFLSPVPYRGKKNEPAYVIKVAEKIAEIKSISLEEVASATTQNAKKIYGLTA